MLFSYFVKQLPQPLRSHSQSFGTQGHRFKITLICLPKNQKRFSRIVIFLKLEALGKFQNHATTPSGGMSKEAREKEREKKNRKEL
jgi:hypothetical protein